VKTRSTRKAIILIFVFLVFFMGYFLLESIEIPEKS